MMLYLKKYMFFHDYFHKLEIFNMKFITEIQFCMKKYSWKNYNVFPSIGRYITSHIAKFEAKIPLVSEEIKKKKFE